MTILYFDDQLNNTFNAYYRTSYINPDGMMIHEIDNDGCLVTKVDSNQRLLIIFINKSSKDYAKTFITSDCGFQTIESLAFEFKTK